jgi:uncharacterized tellurite resistance protein B-like protein
VEAAWATYFSRPKEYEMDRGDSFRNLLIMAASDGRMSESELRMLADRAAEWGITDDQFEQAIQDAISGRAELTLPSDAQGRNEILKDLIRMMGADGRILDGERQLFAFASSILGIEQVDLNQLIDEVLSEDC